MHDTSDTSPENSSGLIENSTPFESAEEAWFWFIAAQEAKNSGARFVAGAGLHNRPCEPVDILKCIDRLYRNRRLKRDHIMVLKHYGVRHMAPDYARAKERRSYHLWCEALEILEELMMSKGIVKRHDDFELPAFICNEVLKSEKGFHA